MVNEETIQPPEPAAQPEQRVQLERVSQPEQRAGEGAHAAVCPDKGAHTREAVLRGRSRQDSAVRRAKGWSKGRRERESKIESLDEEAAVRRVRRVYRARRRQWMRSTPARAAFYAAATLFTMLVLSACVLGGSALHVYGQAKETATEAKLLCSQVLAGDKESAQDSAASVAARVRGLSGELSWPIWSLATLLPAVGSDISRVRELAAVAADLCDGALVSYVQALPADTPVQPLRADKSIDAYALQTLVRPLASVSASIKRAADEMQQMGGSDREQLDEAIGAAKTGLSLLDGLAQNADTAADKLPAMLGEEGDRSYLLVAQQNSELRSTGGFWGSAGILSLRKGKIELGEFSTGAHFSNYLDESQALSETEEEKVLFGERVCRIPADSNFIPDFPTAIGRYREMWLRCGQPDVQGAIALDPVFLQWMLALTGGITTESGTVVDGTNAARILEHDIYYELPVKEQDAFFSEVAKLAFAKLMASNTHIDASAALRCIGRAFDTRRLQLWMVDDDEESVMLSLGCAGEVSSDIVDPVLGVYFNNSSYSKLSGWLKAETRIAGRTENADGSTSYEVVTTMTNTMAAEEEEGLPKYVAASNTTGVCPTKGSMALWTYVYAPEGGNVENMSCEARFADRSDVDKEAWIAGEPGDGMSRVLYDSRDVWFGVVLLSPGESATLSYTVTTPSGNGLDLDTTPLGQFT